MLELYQDKTNLEIFFTYSHWEKEQNLEDYRNSDLFKNVWATTKTFFNDKPEAWSLDNKYYLQAGASITSASINLPLDRLYIKSENLKDAMNTQYETWQRLAMLAGYSKWNLGIEDGNNKKSSDGLNFDTINFGDSLKFDKIEF